MNLAKITQRYLQLFPADLSNNARQRQVLKIVSCTVSPAYFEGYKLLFFNEDLAEEIGLGKIESENDIDFLAAQNLPKNIQPFATAYAGHQFGHWAGQLGDGRAIYAGEIECKNHFYELQWKGAGATPFSRTADGRAVLRSSVREFLMSEAMHHLHIPTTRALSLCLTGESVVRDILYSGNPQPEPGAVIIRSAESFLRFGHFEYLSAQKEYDILRTILDFCIVNYFKTIDINSTEKYKFLFAEIVKNTANLMVDWSRVGFTHGVMNTDNMSVLGLTIDYGPFGMLEEYNPFFTPNTTDLPHRRYAFGEQAQIAQWNLWKLANALFPVIEDEKFLSQQLDFFNEYYNEKHNEMFAYKLGLNYHKTLDGFILKCQELMMNLELDYTLFFVKLEQWNPSCEPKTHFESCFYKDLNLDETNSLIVFLNDYSQLISDSKISENERVKKMQKNNPKFILRNYLLYECIEEAEKGNRQKFDALFSALQNPYCQPDNNLQQKRPTKYNNQPGCSMLSCSS